MQGRPDSQKAQKAQKTDYRSCKSTEKHSSFHYTVMQTLCIMQCKVQIRKNDKEGPFLFTLQLP